MFVTFVFQNWVPSRNLRSFFHTAALKSFPLIARVASFGRGKIGAFFSKRIKGGFFGRPFFDRFRGNGAFFRLFLRWQI